MCEPMHSFVQMDDDDYPDQNSGGGGAKCAASRFISGVKDLSKKIGRFFHFTQFGASHSKMLSELGVNGRSFYFGISSTNETPLIKWESDWTKRKLVFDSAFMRQDPHAVQPQFSNRIIAYERAARTKVPSFVDKKETAQKYMSSSVTGNMRSLRNFITESMKKTNARLSYVEKFREILTEKHADIYWSKVNAILGTRTLNRRSSFSIERAMTPSKVSQITSLMCGYTRKRGVLIPCWADDADLWGRKK